MKPAEIAAKSPSAASSSESSPSEGSGAAGDVSGRVGPEVVRFVVSLVVSNMNEGVALEP